jgi:hypothetical protein
MDKSEKPRRLRKFVKKHKVAITVIVTSVVWIKLNKVALAQHNDFLKEHGLYDEFYSPSDEEMGEV